MAVVRATVKALVVVVMSAAFLGALALVAPAAPIVHSNATPPRDSTGTDLTVRTTDLTDITTRTVRTDIIVLLGTVNVTVNGPGKVNGCGPDDGVSKQKVCSFSDLRGSDVSLAATLQNDANTSARFTGWSGSGCSGTAGCLVTVGATPLAVTATFVDDHRPTVTVTKPAAGELIITPTGKIGPVVGLDETGLTPMCQVDSGSPVACSNATVPGSPADPTSHTLTANVTDRWGNASNTVTRSFNSYVTQDTVINGGPAEGAAINTSAVSFGFAATKGAAKFTCTVGTLSDSNCISGKPWNLDDGTYTFTVASRVENLQPGGLTAVDPSPAVRHFTVDTKPPDTTLAAGPADGLLTNVRSGAFTFTSNEPGAVFECSLNGAAFDACPGGTNGAANYPDVGVGKVTFAVRAKDSAGNVDPSPAERAWTVTADLDADTFTLPGDCDDNNAAIHPGAAEILDNGVDENCNGLGDDVNLDRDGDHFPRPQDCNDANAAIHPGAQEIVGNAVDENCDGIVEPFPTLPSSVGYIWVPKGSATVLKSFFIRNAQPGSMVRVSCAKKCGIKTQTARVTAAKKVLDLTKTVKGKRFKPGTVIEITVTKPQTIGSYTSLKMRPKGGPLKTERCLPPGASAPRAC